MFLDRGTVGEDWLAVDRFFNVVMKVNAIDVNAFVTRDQVQLTNGLLITTNELIVKIYNK